MRRLSIALTFISTDITTQKGFVTKIGKNVLGYKFVTHYFGIINGY
jgi:hypothetical protein